MNSGRNNSIEGSDPVLLSKIQSSNPLEGISLISLCANQNVGLLASLESWIDLAIHEILIVDFCSDTPVTETLISYDDPRIKIIRFEDGSSTTILSALNVGMRLASYGTIYSFDVGTTLNDDFLALSHIDEGEYIRARSETEIGQEKCRDIYSDDSFISSSFGCHKDQLMKIGFYNELITNIAFGEYDLYDRLERQCHLIVKHFSPGAISSSPEVVKTKVDKASDIETLFLGEISSDEFDIRYSQQLIALYGDWDCSDLEEYEIFDISSSQVRAVKQAAGSIIPQFYFDSAIHYASIYFVKRVFRKIFASISDPAKFADRMYDLYQANVDFSELETMLGLEDSYPVVFADDSNVGDCIKSMIPRTAEHPLKKCLIYVAGPRSVDIKRVVVRQYGLQFVVTTLARDKYDALLDMRTQIILLYGNQYKLPFNATYRRDISLSKVLAISVYDEQQPHRIQEYLSCLKRNAEIFDVLLLFYEESDGSFLTEVSSRFTSEALAQARCEIIVINIDKRPTFRSIFDDVDAIYAGAQVFVANADIAFTKSVENISPEVLLDNFMVVSRKETIPYSQVDAGYIMDRYGLPNTFSADVWIYQAPIKYDFKADFGIGTFHCDSYLNYYISKSGYKLFNPCLDVEILHIHDERFNSSQAKQLGQNAEIQKALQQELKKTAGDFPLTGVQWCRTKDSLDNDKANQIVRMSDVVIKFEVASDGSNLFDVLIKMFMCKSINTHIASNSGIWLRIGEADRSSNIADILFDLKAILDDPGVLVGVSNAKASKEVGEKNPAFVLVNDSQLLATYKGSLQHEDIEIYGNTGIKFENTRTYGIAKKITLACDIETSDLAKLEVSSLLKILSHSDQTFMHSALMVLIERGHCIFKPLLLDLDIVLSETSEFTS